MPYIKAEQRHRLDRNPYAASDAGELNYVITKACLLSENRAMLENKIHELVNAYLDKYGRRYSSYNDVLGVLIAARFEYGRRKDLKPELVLNHPVMQVLVNALASLYFEEIAPYEDAKIKENGDVY
jgi:hypothetical protein